MKNQKNDLPLTNRVQTPPISPRPSIRHTNHRRKGFAGGATLIIGGMIASAIVGSASGYAYANNAPIKRVLLNPLLVPGPFLGAVGGGLMVRKGVYFGAFCVGLEAASFGIGYGIGYLSK